MIYWIIISVLLIVLTLFLFRNVISNMAFRNRWYSNSSTNKIIRINKFSFNTIEYYYIENSGVNINNSSKMTADEFFDNYSGYELDKEQNEKFELEFQKNLKLREIELNKSKNDKLENLLNSFSYKNENFRKSMNVNIKQLSKKEIQDKPQDRLENVE